MSRIDTKSLIEMCVPGLGDGDKSPCLDDWLESFLEWAEAKEERMFSPAMINALFHTFAGGKVRVERLVAERNLGSKNDRSQSVAVYNLLNQITKNAYGPSSVSIEGECVHWWDELEKKVRQLDRALHFAAGKMSTFLDPDEDHSEDIYNQFLKEVKTDD